MSSAVQGAGFLCTHISKSHLLNLSTVIDVVVFCLSVLGGRLQDDLSFFSLMNVIVKSIPLLCNIPWTLFVVIRASASNPEIIDHKPVSGG